MSKGNVKELDHAVIKFVGDSGDGMQLIGTLFSDDAAIYGNDLATFPDYPAEIRAPHNTIAGVSGFQVHIGKNKIYTPGDKCDVIVAMNPASLKANLKWAKKGTIIIVDTESFEVEALTKAGYKENPLENGSLNDYHAISMQMATLTKESVKELNLDVKIILRSKNMFALGIVLALFNRNLDNSNHYFEHKFGKNPQVVLCNKSVLKAGYDYLNNIPQIQTFKISPAVLKKGKYRNITGNVATAWGLMAASEKANKPIFLGSYPITPATEIMIELSKHKSLGVKVFQAEDEIAGITSAIGASFAGAMAVTSTSGPGLSLKVEAIGLAVMTELPLVIIDVQRAGPSTGLPTKSEQSDLMQALFGRNGEAPIVVLAASSSANCFDYAYMAAKIALEHMTPVMLLTDGNLGNGSELFRIPKMSDIPAIHPPIAQSNDPDYKPYKRDPETLVRKWAIPGTPGLRHRIGGLEKENITGVVSTDPANHELMVKLRAEKVQKVADSLPAQKVNGSTEGDLLIVSWGGTEGSVYSAFEAMQKEGKKIAHTHFNYIMPLPKNTEAIFCKYKKILVCENNNGQFINYLRMVLPQYAYEPYNKVQCLPFTIDELITKFNQILGGKI